MQLIDSELPKDEYLTSMKNQLESPFHLYSERYCGFILGSFFYVIHHCEHQWDRKFGSPKNAAFGYVREDGDTSCVRFFTFKGLLCPSQFLLALLLSFLAGFITLLFTGYAQYMFSPLTFCLVIASVVISAPISALFENMSERSAEGENSLLALLYNPKF